MGAYATLNSLNRLKNHPINPVFHTILQLLASPENRAKLQKPPFQVVWAQKIAKILFRVSLWRTICYKTAMKKD